MKKILVLGVALVVCAVIFTGCIPKEIRTAKIELGTRNKPRPNPDIDRVKANLTKSVELYPDNAEVYYLWGWVYSMEGNYEEMDKFFIKSEELSPAFKPDADTIRMIKWKVLIDQASDASQNEDFETALKKFKESIICWKDRFEPYMYGADAAYRIGQKEEAYELSKKAYELVPDSLIVQKLYADMCLVNNKFSEAETICNSMLEKDPTNPQILFSLGDIFITRNDTTKALEYYNQALEVDKENAEGWFNIGILYFQLRNFCKAAECLEHYTSLAEPDADIKILYSRSLYECGDLEKCKTELEKFTIEHPDNCEGWRLMANTYLKLKMKKEATEANNKYKACQGK